MQRCRGSCRSGRSAGMPPVSWPSSSAGDWKSSTAAVAAEAGGIAAGWRFTSASVQSPSPLTLRSRASSLPLPHPLGHRADEADLPFLGEVEVFFPGLGDGAVGVFFPEDAGRDEVGAGAAGGDVDRGDVAGFAEFDDCFGFGVEGEQVAAFDVEDPLAAFGDAGEGDVFADLVGGRVVLAQVERAADFEGDAAAVGRDAQIMALSPAAGVSSPGNSETTWVTSSEYGHRPLGCRSAARQARVAVAAGRLSGLKDDVGAVLAHEVPFRARVGSQAAPAGQRGVAIGVAHIASCSCLRLPPSLLRWLPRMRGPGQGRCRRHVTVCWLRSPTVRPGGWSSRRRTADRPVAVPVEAAGAFVPGRVPPLIWKENELPAGDDDKVRSRSPEAPAPSGGGHWCRAE